MTTEEKNHVETTKKWDADLNFEPGELLKKFKIESEEDGCCILVNSVRDRFVRGYVLGDLRRGEEYELNRAREYAIKENTRQILEKHKEVHEKQRLQKVGGTLARQQALSLLGKVYVGGINLEVTELEIKQAFCVFGPLKYVNMSIDPSTRNHKGFAFLEYETPEGGQMAIDYMDNAILGAKNIKVGRPGPMEHSRDLINKMAVEAEKLNRIYVSSIAPSVKSDDITKIFSVFGTIRQCELIRSVRRDKLACAYIGFDSPVSARTAVASMNNFDLVGHILKVVKAVTPDSSELGTHSKLNVMPTDVAVTIAEISATVAAVQAQEKEVLLPRSNVIERKTRNKFSEQKPPESGPTIIDPLKIPGLLPTKSNGEERPLSPKHEEKAVKREKPIDDTLESEENFNIKAKQRKAIMEKLNHKIPKRVMLLRNMVSVDEVDDYLKDEVAEECRRYGEVREVTVYLRGDEESEVRVFVEFGSPEEAERTVLVMNGRQFGGRIVSATLYNQESYDLGDLNA